MSSSKPLILVVEDDKQIADLVAAQLQHAGMHSHVIHRAGQVAKFLEKNFVNLILLDVNLPDGTGFTVIEQIRATGNTTPVIFLTGDDSETAKVRGLEQGGDDYITKPFSFPELVARIHAVLRRAETAHDTQITNNTSLNHEPFDFCGAQVIPAKLEVIFPDGKAEKLGRKELGILTYLKDHEGGVIARRSLIHGVWGIHADVRSRSLDQYIVKIRTLFAEHGLQLEQFKTIHGVGYTYQP